MTVRRLCGKRTYDPFSAIVLLDLYVRYYEKTFKVYEKLQGGGSYCSALQAV